MKLLLVSAFCVVLAPLSSAQSTHAASSHVAAQISQNRPSLQSLPQTTLDFKPVGAAIGDPTKVTIVSRPFCSADGMLYLDTERLPSHDRQIIVISPKGKRNSLSLRSVPGLTNVYIRGIDAHGPDIYAWGVGDKTKPLLSKDASAANDARNAGYFILRITGRPSAPDVIPLHLPFEPIRFAALDDNTFVFLGLDQANLAPVLAVVDGSGQPIHFIDAYYAFGTGDSIVAHMLPSIKGGGPKLPEAAALPMAMNEAELVHSRDSLLFLLPGSDAKVFTIGSDGGFKSTKLDLPAGLEADSLIASDHNWLVGALEPTTNTGYLFMVDPSTGKAMRVVHVRGGFPICVHDGDYYDVHWGSKKISLMKATP